MGTSASSSSSSMGSGSGDFASDMGSGISDFASDMGSGISDFASDVSDVFSSGPDYAEGAQIDDLALEAETKAFEKLGDVPTDPAAKEKYYEDFAKLEKEYMDEHSPSFFDEEKLKKFSEKTKGSGQNNQQVVRGSGPAGYSGPSARSSYVPAQSPYQITRRGPSTGELEKMLLQGLKTSANMRISEFKGPRIRGLFG
jgi:hypothetical protein